MEVSQENRAYKVSPRVFILALISLVIGVILVYTGDYNVKSIYTSLDKDIIRSNKRIPLFIIVLAIIGFVHAITKSLEKTAPLGGKTSFHMVTWFSSITKAAGIGIMFDSGLRIFTSVMGEMVGEKDFLKHNDHYHLTSLLIITVLLIFLAAGVTAKMVTEVIPDSWKRKINQRKNRKSKAPE